MIYALTILLLGDVGSNPLTPNEVVKLVVADLTTLESQDRQFQRYIYITPESAPAINYVVNSVISKTNTIRYPKLVADNNLARWDLRSLTKTDAELLHLISLWERLADEPYFHQSIQKYPPIYAGHIDPRIATLLSGLTKSSAAIVRSDWFITKTFTTIDGGLYYDFLGVRDPAKKTKNINQTQFLAQHGVDEEKVKELRSDQRVALLHSAITGKPRRIDFFRGLGGRDGTGIVTITHDLSDKSFEADRHPIRNLLSFVDAGREIILEKNNGLLIFALSNNQGEIVDEVPPDITKDHTIPAPFTARLQPGISCVRCHFIDGSDGYKPFHNDIKTLTQNPNGFKLLGDNQGSQRDTYDRLQGLYDGNPDKFIRRGRDDLSDAIFKTTGGKSTKQLGESIVNTYNNYNYKLVNARIALYELGIPLAPKDNPTIILSNLVGRWPKDEDGISPDDPLVVALLVGLEINRKDFEQIFADMAIRSHSYKDKSGELKR